MFHERVLGVESRNLDTFFAGKEGVLEILKSCKKEYAVIEGVMGLYDGINVSGIEGSGYETAKITGTPIVLVMDASAVGRTVISLIKGMLLDDTEHLIKGIILNRISKSYYEKLEPVLKDSILQMRADVRLLGFLPKDPGISIESRHLGLVLPGEIKDIREKISQAALLLEKNTDMATLRAIMDDSVTEGFSESRKKQIDPPRYMKKTNLTLAVARDDAFCFYYRDNLELIEKKGVSVRFFSPLCDTGIDENVNGILLGGGYPELYLKQLSENKSMLESVRKALDNGIPSLAECGGFMYLHKRVTDKSGKRFEIAGVCDGDCNYSGHLVRFGYMEIIKVNNSDTEGMKKEQKTRYKADGFIECMTGLRGHEFHYYESTCSKLALTAAKPDKSKEWGCMVTGNNGIWGFPHFYYNSKPEFIDYFIQRMKEVSVG